MSVSATSLALSMNILGTGSFWPSADEGGICANATGVSGSGCSLAEPVSWGGILRVVGNFPGSNVVPNEAAALAAVFAELLRLSSDKPEGTLEAPDFFDGEDESALFGNPDAFDMDPLSLFLGVSAVWSDAGMML